MNKILRVLKIRHTSDYRLYVELNNGVTGEIDLSSKLDGPIFQPLRAPEIFASAKIEGGTVTWSNDADLAPEYLHTQLAEQSL